MLRGQLFHGAWVHSRKNYCDVAAARKRGRPDAVAAAVGGAGPAVEAGAGAGLLRSAALRRDEPQRPYFGDVLEISVVVQQFAISFND